jgi:hypothetical protein
MELVTRPVIVPMGGPGGRRGVHPTGREAIIGRRVEIRQISVRGAARVLRGRGARLLLFIYSLPGTS